MQEPKIESQKLLHPVIFTTTFIIAALLFGCDESASRKKSASPIKGKGLQASAHNIIEQGLKSPDPKIRANAIEVVAAARQKYYLPQLSTLLGDDYIPVRFAAALAVGDTQYYMAANKLQRLVTKADENTKIAAAYALYKLGRKQYLETIKKAVTSYDQTLRANAVVLLGKTKNQSVLQLLYWAKDDVSSDPKVRYQATKAIAQLGDEKIYEKILTQLVSKYADNKMIGIEAMYELGTPLARDAILTKLDDDVLEVRLAAADKLALLGDKSGSATVLSVFKENLTYGMDEASTERILALSASAIGSIKTKKLSKYLPELINNKSAIVRLAAAKAVLQLKNDS